jgi:hypothetical protein
MEQKVGEAVIFLTIRRLIIKKTLKISLLIKDKLLIAVKLLGVYGFKTKTLSNYLMYPVE